MSEVKQQSNEHGTNGRRGNDEGDTTAVDSPKEPRYARMPVSKDDEFYNMNHKNRGKAIIFNHRDYDINLPPRTGTDVDCEKLYEALVKLKFDVTVQTNLTAEKMSDQLKAIAKMDHTENDCLLVVVLTYGEQLGELYARDTHYKTETLWKYFTGDKCPTLAGKPKLFFIQACQVDRKFETDGILSSYKIPSYSDILISICTVPGSYSWDNTNTKCSWYVQALFEQLSNLQYGIDISILLTLVCNKVKSMYKSDAQRELYKLKIQPVPLFTNMLTRNLLFNEC